MKTICRIIKKLLKYVLLISIDIVVLFGLKMILPASGQNTISSNNTEILIRRQTN